MFKIMGRLLRMAAFWNDRRGNVAIIAGLSLLPITVLAGSAIDMADIIADRSRIQHALDIAALDTARKISNDLDFADNESDVLDYAVSAFHANFPDSQVSGSRITTNDGRLAIDLSQTLVRNAGVVREVKLTADADHSPAFMGIALGNGAIETKTVAAAMVRNDTFDVVMVLDNSGSMGGNRISTLRSAATDLTNILMAMNDTGGVSDRVQVGLVPFSTYVNVGPTRINANWLDKEGLSSIHSENFDTPTNRFTLFDQMTDISWAGCVESRPSPYDVTDAKPKKKTPDTLFVPVFAPDEPDWDNDDGDSYYNDYLDDEGGSCTGNLPNGSDRPVAAQARTCKYSGTPSSSATNDNGTNSGPNQLCHVQPLTVLTSNKTKVLSAITAMEAEGTTNIHQGVMWGWRVLSKEKPFRQSREDDKQDHNKVMIMMTDGDNYYGYTNNNHNKSRYGAYGYAAMNRIEASPLSSNGWLAKSNEKTAAACANAKAAGILVYSIAFKLSNPSTVDLMRNCATRSDMFFSSSSNAELTTAFQEIAESISKLRLSQ